MGAFEEQVQTLVARGYPQAAGLDDAQFMAVVDPLREPAARLAEPAGDDGRRIPFVIVVTSRLVAAQEAIARVRRRGERGFSVMDADDLARFAPIAAVRLPAGDAYLLGDVETGTDTLNVTPDGALDAIVRRGRSPLTIDEGIALVTHHPESVARNGGFSLLGSRCGDRRVTALWISKGRPKLGWCWAGNPHSWLGSASCGGRLGTAT